MKWSQRTDVGLVRQSNEDSMLVVPDLGLLAVADGMGGHLAGEVASRVALEVLERDLRQNGNTRRDPGRALAEAVQQANQKIFDLAEQNSDQRGMGTTITACLLIGQELWVAQVGDSRAYLKIGRAHV